MEYAAIILAQTEPPSDADAGTGGRSAAQQTASWVLIAAAIVLLTWVMMRLQWRRQRRSPDEEPVAEMRETLVDRQADMERAAEVGEIVRDLASRLETRAARLEALLDQADERIEKLEARLAAGAVSGSVAASDRPTPTMQLSQNGAGDPWTDDQDAPTTPANGHDPLHQEVYELADGGRTPLDIARRLDQQVGTIELILALRQ
ncbi:MAG: hypothetical protein NCW75_05855 [Phycisphaera sp.]|nr:MAG: hypothetical protein NCW75_05855 [Phycisphaera sp.]